MNLDEKFFKVNDLIDETLTEKEMYVVFANKIFKSLEEKTKHSKYEYEDLQDYTYVLEYLQYNPDDSVLILAHTAHSLLFLSNLNSEV